METRQILILTHGRFGKELVHSAELIIGSVEEVTVVSLLPDDSADTFLTRVEDAIRPICDENILCLVDLYGGSPCNTALRLSRNHNIRVVCGLNLPMFIEAYNQVKINRDGDLTNLVQISKDGVFDATARLAAQSD